jgi:hypothetical protein
MGPILPDVGVFIAPRLGERWCWKGSQNGTPDVGVFITPKLGECWRCKGSQNKLLDASVVEAEIGSKKDKYSSLRAKTRRPKFRGAQTGRLASSLVLEVASSSYGIG